MDAPANEAAYNWQAAQGQPMPALCWEPEGPARASILCVHGLGGAAADFRPLGATLSRQGYAVHALNLRGFGLDPRPRWRGHIDHESSWYADLRAFDAALDARGVPRPRFWAGESLGALMLINFFSNPAQTIRPQGLVMFSAVPAVEFRIGPVTRQLIRALIRLFPRLKLRPDAFIRRQETVERPPVTRDEAYAERMLEQPHRLEKFSLSFYGALARLLEAAPARAPCLHAPVLYLYAGNDCFIKPADSEAFFALIGSADKSRRYYPEAHHLLQFDPLTPHVLSDVQAWLDEPHEPASAPPKTASG